MADYRDKNPDQTAAFIERVADHLRSPERLDPSFDGRLIDKVRMEARSVHPATRGEASWWRTQRVVRFSPLGAIALAAGVSMFVALSTVAVGSRVRSRSDAPRAVSAVGSKPAASDTVNLIRFVFVDSHAQSVELVGDFNEWTKGATQLKPSGAPGVWAVSVALPAGRHEYAFIINGTRWIADPLATKSSDDFGTESSVIQVGSGRQRAT
jgi:Glycogen recognition site of AMP-activated protein kinase